jgi:hypothetical protein
MLAMPFPHVIDNTRLVGGQQAGRTNGVLECHPYKQPYPLPLVPLRLLIPENAWIHRPCIRRGCRYQPP